MAHLKADGKVSKNRERLTLNWREGITVEKSQESLGRDVIKGQVGRVGQG